MKAYKIEILVIDHDNVGLEGIKEHIESVKYPNYCISPKVKSIVEKDIGKWEDNHPLNKSNTCNEYYDKLFNT